MYIIKRDGKEKFLPTDNVIVTVSNDRIYYESVPLTKLKIKKNGFYLSSIEAPIGSKVLVYDINGVPIKKAYYSDGVNNANKKYSFPQVLISKIKLVGTNKVKTMKMKKKIKMKMKTLNNKNKKMVNYMKNKENKK